MAWIKSEKRALNIPSEMYNLKLKNEKRNLYEEIYQSYIADDYTNETVGVCQVRFKIELEEIVSEFEEKEKE